MDDRAAASASDSLWDCWRQGRRLDTLPADIRPAHRRDGYRIQASLEARSGAPLPGWKIAATSIAGQRHINVDGPLVGRILAERIYPAGATLPFGANAMAVAEPEFCFRMARTLAPRAEPYGVDEVMDAAGDLHLAIEVPDSRFVDFTAVGAAQLIADNACAHDFVLGDAVAADWRALDLSRHPVVARVVGGPDHHGSGANVLGDPRVALTWAVNELSGLGLALAAGQFVTTGTSVVPVPIRPGDRFEADFGPLGRIACAFGP